MNYLKNLATSSLATIRTIPLNSQHSTLLAIFIAFLAIAYSLPSWAAGSKRNVQSERYVVNQTFDGQSFFKDNNVWVYTPKFAETFGMPLEGVYPELKGIEAAAFRIEDTNYKLCGMGGKAENCKDNYRYILDIYVDETKYPLPWAALYPQIS